MAKLQFKLSIQPGIGINGIGYLLDLTPVVVRNATKGYEITPARPFEEVTTLGGVTFHAILELGYWETETETEARIKGFPAGPCPNKIPPAPLLNWSEGEEIGDPSHFVIHCLHGKGTSMVAEKSSLVFAGNKAACEEYVVTHPSNAQEVYYLFSPTKLEE